MPRHALLGLALALFPLVFSPALSAAPSVVRVEKTDAGGWTLLRDGQPYVIRGAGGSEHLELLKELGGNTIRTWGIEQLDRKENGKSLLDRCHELGLTVMAGIWIGHERHGFNYSDPAQVKRQRDEVRAAVRRHRDHPALLVWGLGNEMEGPDSPGTDPRIWRELDVLARIVKEEDPNHPVCTVIAGAASPKVRALVADYRSLDILGVNAYGGAAGAGKAAAAAGWTGPVILAEFGPVGHWEVGKAPWGAPIEPSSREKASNYYSTIKGAFDESGGRLLGTFAFVWGQKQETTATWYGMFLQTGEKTPAVDAVSYAWTGRWPANRSPSIRSLESPARLQRVRAGSAQTARAEVIDPDKDPVSLTWIVKAESTDRRVGGDREAEPPSFPELTRGATGPEIQFTAPSKRGAYRLFLYARDGKGGASADNFPFYVE